MSTVNQFRFVTRGGTETLGYGPIQDVIRVADGAFLGSVRRVVEPTARGNNWVVYDVSGNETSVSDLRITAANFMSRDYDRAKEQATR